MSECDVEGIICELETLRHLKALERLQGEETISTKFPELIGLKDKLSAEIISHRDSLKEAIIKCGRLPEGDLVDMTEEEMGELE